MRLHKTGREVNFLFYKPDTKAFIEPNPNVLYLVLVSDTFPLVVKYYEWHYIYITRIMQINDK